MPFAVLHLIESDLDDWEDDAFASELAELETLLARHAEFVRQFPETER